MAEWFDLLQKSIWCGVAAVGFGILFNVPRRTLWIIGVMGMAGGATKFTVLLFGNGIIIASLLAAILVGFLSIPAAHRKHSPPMIFAIPSVIPLVPGAFAYRTMLGLINLTGNVTSDTYSTLMQETMNNGLKTVFVLMSLAVGVFFPMLISRRETFKQIRTKGEAPENKPA
jgi:uncharacterized membrane protein YjjB (DUF3815 family)